MESPCLIQYRFLSCVRHVKGDFEQFHFLIDFFYKKVSILNQTSKRSNNKNNYTDVPRQRAGKMECPHSEHEIPPWKRDKKRARLVQQIMSTDKALYLRENAGVVQKLDNTAFQHADIEAVFAEPEIDVTAETANTIFVCIDTAGGGQSCTAVCTGFYTKSHKLILLGAESVVLASDKELERCLQRHLERVRHRFGAATIVTIIEQNYGGWVGASRVAALVDPFQPCLHMSRDSSGQGKIGVITTHESKEAMRVMLQDKLRSERFAFAKQFISDAPDIKEEIKSQLKAYRYIDKGGENEGVPKRRVLSGKGNGRNDDLAIGVQFLAFWPSFYFQNQRCAKHLV